MVQLILDGGRKEARFFTTLAVVLIVIRGIAFALDENLSFDSEQAIIGLMAKHLSEFRTFPLFTYGQHYQLGVESWLIAPFFWIFRPSVAVMRIPLIVIHIVIAILLIRLARTGLGLRPAVGFLAALPFIVPTPIMAITLMENTGGAVEPLLYVLLLWILRRRPLAFGAVLAFGFLHREFTAYAIPALVAVEMAAGSFWTRANARRVALGAAGLALVAVTVDDVKMHLDGYSLLMDARQLVNSTCFEARGYFDQLRNELRAAVPILAGGTPMSLHVLAKRSPAIVGSRVVGWVLCGAGILTLFRLAWLWKRGRRADVGLGMYLALVGCCSLVAYPISCATNVNPLPIFRYLTLAMILPVGAFLTFMVFEQSRYLKAAAVSVFVLWGAANLADNARVLYQAYVTPEPDPRRELTDFLLSQHIRYARAAFWDAYEVDFLSKERVIVASYLPSRIPEYEHRVEEHRDAAVDIVRMPCEGRIQVAAWCIQFPAR